MSSADLCGANVISTLSIVMLSRWVIISVDFSCVKAHQIGGMLCFPIPNRLVIHTLVITSTHPHAHQHKTSTFNLHPLPPTHSIPPTRTHRLFPGRMKPYLSVGMKTINPCSCSDAAGVEPRAIRSKSFSDSLSLKKRRRGEEPGGLGLEGEGEGDWVCGLWANLVLVLRRRLCRGDRRGPKLFAR